MLKIIHTGDIHIGAKFSSFGEKAPDQRKALLDVFAKTVDIAISEKVHLMLIAGDLFDSNFPSHSSVNFIKSQLKRLDKARIYTAMLPGTHDCLSSDSIYLREQFAQDLSYIFVFDDPDIDTKEFSEIDVTVFGKANISNKSTESPVTFLKEAGGRVHTQYKVAMAHGSIQIEGKSSPDDTPIAFSDIGKSGMHYIALGHWHGAQDFSSSGVTTWYSGSPEITYLEGKGGLGAGNVLMIEITDDGTQVKPIQVSEKKFSEVRLDMQIHEDMENIYREIEKLQDIQHIVTIVLFGLIDSDIFIDTKKIAEDFSDKFFHIKVKNETMQKIETMIDNKYPDALVIGQFIHIMRIKLEETKDAEEKKIITDALHIGIAELEGKNVIE